MKISFSILFAICYTAIVHAQDYIPIINSNNTWYTVEGGISEPPTSGRYTYSIDSVGAGPYYFDRLYSDNEDGSDPFVTGSFREEGGRLYEKRGSGEIVLLDMSLDVGDLFLGVDDIPMDSSIVTNVDTITLLDGIPRKQITISCRQDPDSYGSRIWIEGIGSVYSEGYPLCAIVDGGPRISCFYAGDEQVYDNSFIEDCWLYNIPEFAPFGAKWYVPIVSGFDWDVTVRMFEVVGDTFIDGYYMKTIETGLETCDIGVSDKEHIWVSGNKVYRYNDDSVLELVIDFGAKVGDSWTVQNYSFFNSPSTLTCRVDSIGLTILDGHSLRTQFVTLFDVEFGIEIKNRIIERIGFQNSLFPRGYCNILDVGYTENVRCYEDNVVGLIKFDELDCDYTTVATEDISETNFKIFPNPVNEYLHINTEVLYDMYKIYDTGGRLVKTGKLEDYISTSKMPKGLYVLSLMDKNGNTNFRKFIKN